MKLITISSLLLIGLISYSMDNPNPTPSLSGIPDLTKETILRNLIFAKGSTEEARLFKAVENIRSLLIVDKSFQKFNNDFAFNNFIITELAKQYTGGDEVKAAIALNTMGAGLWLQETVKTDENIKRKLISAFIDAAARGQIGIIRFLLRYDDNYKNAAQQGFTPLKAAIVNDRDETVRELLKAGAFPAGNALLLAAHNGNAAIAKMLLDAGAAPAIPDNQGNLPIHAAAQNGHTKVVSLLLEKHPTLVNMPNAQGVTALIAAAAEGHADTVNTLLSAGADPDNATAQGFTALMVATQNGHLDVVEKLLARHVDINRAESGGMTALSFAANNNRPKVVARLIQAGANINHRTTSGATAFLFAAQSGDLESIELLLRMRVDINQTDTSGNNALIAAAALGRINVVKKLIASGIKVNHKNNSGQTALDVARAAQILNKDAIIKLLEEANSQE